MTIQGYRMICFPVMLVLITLSACEKQGEVPKRSDSSSKPDKPSPSTTKSDAPKPTPARSETASAVTDSKGMTLTLSGLTMTVPQGWIAEAVTPGPMAAKAAYRIPHGEGDDAECAVRITHFPDMKGKDKMNINRWLGQVQRPDGKPFTRDDAKIEVEEKSAIRLTIVDVSGTVSTNMAGGPGESNQRMIAAIIDHPQGPHFIKVTGGEASIAQSADVIYAFLKSAKVAD